MSPYFLKTKDGLSYYCPACDLMHPINFNWVVSGTPEEPTIWPAVNIPLKCNSNVTKGIIHYHSDCRHKYAGRDLPMVKISDIPNRKR